jgi:hypothetical protein
MEGDRFHLHASVQALDGVLRIPIVAKSDTGEATRHSILVVQRDRLFLRGSARSELKRDWWTSGDNDGDDTTYNICDRAVRFESVADVCFVGTAR